jgi:hypothetical protein
MSNVRGPSDSGAGSGDRRCGEFIMATYHLQKDMRESGERI